MPALSSAPLVPDLSGTNRACAPFSISDTQATVVRNEAVNADYRRMILRARGLSMTARPGQFFNIACPTTRADSPYLRRPMSVYGITPAKGRIEFLYKVAGAGTRGLAMLRVGDRIAMLGPLGNGFTLSPLSKNIVVLGRGVGLATLAPLAEMAFADGVGVTAILSARTPALVMSRERFAKAGAEVEIVTDSDGSSDPANVEAILRRLIGAGKADAFYTCGSNRLMLTMKRVARTFGISGQVALEQQMACGLGMCFCCVRTFESASGSEQRRVCREGPVFPIAEALSW